MNRAISERMTESRSYDDEDLEPSRWIMSSSSGSASLVAEAPSATVLSPSTSSSVEEELELVVDQDLDSLDSASSFSFGTWIMCPPELNNSPSRVLHSSFSSGMPSNCSVVFQSRNWITSLNRGCKNGEAQGLVFNDSNMFRRAFGLGTEAAGPGLIQSQNCGRQTLGSG